MLGGVAGMASYQLHHAMMVIDSSVVFTSYHDYSWIFIRYYSVSLFTTIHEPVTTQKAGETKAKK